MKFNINILPICTKLGNLPPQKWVAEWNSPIHKLWKRSRSSETFSELMNIPSGELFKGSELRNHFLISCICRVGSDFHKLRKKFHINSYRAVIKYNTAKDTSKNIWSYLLLLHKHDYAEQYVLPYNIPACIKRVTCFRKISSLTLI